MGFYNQNSANYDRGDGFRLDTSNSEGNRCRWNWAGNRPSGRPTCRVTTALVTTTRRPTAITTAAGAMALIRADHAYGGYVLLQQQLTAQGGDASRGLGVTVQAVMNDHKTSKPTTISRSALRKGPFDARPQMRLASARRVFTSTARIPVRCVSRMMPTAKRISTAQLICRFRMVPSTTTRFITMRS